MPLDLIKFSDLKKKIGSQNILGSQKQCCQGARGLGRSWIKKKTGCQGIPTLLTLLSGANRSVAGCSKVWVRRREILRKLGLAALIQTSWQLGVMMGGGQKATTKFDPVVVWMDLFQRAYSNQGFFSLKVSKHNLYAELLSSKIRMFIYPKLIKSEKVWWVEIWAKVFVC